MIAAALLAALTWSPVALDCNGATEPAPVTYRVPFVQVSMVFLPWCPPDELGNAQACLDATRWEWDAGSSTTWEPPAPLRDQAFIFLDPTLPWPEGIDLSVVAIDFVGHRSDECHEGSP